MPHDYWLILALEMIKVGRRLIESLRHWGEGSSKVSVIGGRDHRKSPSLGGGIIESLRHWGEGSSKVSVIGGGSSKVSVIRHPDHTDF